MAATAQIPPYNRRFSNRAVQESRRQEVICREWLVLYGPLNALHRGCIENPGSSSLNIHNYIHEVWRAPLRASQIGQIWRPRNLANPAASRIRGLSTPIFLYPAETSSVSEIAASTDSGASFNTGSDSGSSFSANASSSCDSSSFSNFKYRCRF